MRYLKSTVALGLVAAMMTLTAKVAPASGQGRYIPVLEQRTAILDCRYEMGLGGPASFGGKWPELPPGGQTVIWIVPGPGLSAAQADRINACADEALGRAFTPRVSTRDEPETSHGCPRHAPVIYGGATYCIGRR